MDISIIIPVYNERRSVGLLVKAIKQVLDNLKKSHEILFVDDGSTDGTFEELENVKRVKIIKFKRNFGQSAAMKAGFDNANGDIIITMDGDLQNDPRDIPKLLWKLNQGYDAVSGWRYKRKDPLGKKIFSLFANSFRQLLIKEKIHDAGCALKAYKKECLRDLELYGEMHRYIITLVSWKGYKIGEVKVNHFPRKFGKTKYGYKRLIKGFLDLLAMKFWHKYSARPLHLFGGIGILSMGFGFLLSFWLTIERLFFGKSLADRPLLLLGVLCIILGIQFFIFGLLADILIKVYYSKKGKQTYVIDKIIEQ